MAGTAVGRGIKLRARRACRGRPSPRMETKPIMKRVFVVSFLSLAAAGCAESRSVLSKQDSPSPGPVAVTPVPSLYDTVNQGMGNPAIVRSAIKDPDNPQWSGRASVAAASPPAATGGAGPSQRPSQATPAGGGAAAPAPLAAQLPKNVGPSAGPVSGADAVSTPAAGGVSGMPLSGGWEGQPAPASMRGPEPAPVATPGTNPVMSDPAVANTGALAGDPVPMPSEPSAAGSPPVVDGLQGAGGPPPGSLIPAAPEEAPANPVKKPIADPLLGPNPELMPPMPDVSELNSRPAPAAAQPARGSASIPPAGPAAALLSEDSVAMPKPSPVVPSVGPSGTELSEGSAASPKPSPVKPPAGPASAMKPAGSVKGPAAIDVKPPASPSDALLPELPAPGPAASATPARAAAAPAPAVIPLEIESAPPASSAADGASDPAAAPKAAGDSAALTEPARAGSVAALPPLVAAPAEATVVNVAVAKPVAQPPAEPRRDPQVVLTAGEKIEKDSGPPATAQSPTDERRRLSLEPGRPLAKVGDEIITFYDLTVATKEQLNRYPELKEAYQSPVGRKEAQKQISMLAKSTLDNLIDRSLLIQDAKHHMKNDAKALEQVNAEADRVFRESEQLPLQRNYHVDTDDQLNEKLAEQGRSLSTMKQSFRQMFLAENFLHAKLKDRVKVEWNDLLKYYDEHVKNHEFDRPALITWREIVVEPIMSTAPPSAPHDSTVLLTSQGTSREVALREANGLLEKLRHGEDFAKLARKESDGPTASRNRGGLMETSPGGYGIAKVNEALESLPIGKISDVIEGPDGFHIVKVEKRRPAGPATFEEVQDQIRPKLLEAKFVAERTAFLAKLRKNTLVTLYNVESSKSLLEKRPERKPFSPTPNEELSSRTR